jgi:ubiquitin C-terminal hydrolase
MSSGAVLALSTDFSVVEKTIFSAACQSRAYCRMCGGTSGSVSAVSQKTVVSCIRRP